MKHFIFTCVFLLFYVILMAQPSIQSIGGGIYFNYNEGKIIKTSIYPITYTGKYSKDEINITLRYHAMHNVLNKKLFFTNSTHIAYLLNSDVLYIGQRAGIAYKDIINNKTPVYFNIGSEANLFYNEGISYGGYINTHFILGKNKKKIIISPELSVVYASYYKISNDLYKVYSFLGGIAIASSWEKNKVYLYDDKKSYINNRFNTGVSVGSFTYMFSDANFYQYEAFFLNVDVNYRLFKARLVSPEVGLGFIYLDSKEKNYVKYDGSTIQEIYYWRQYEYNPYFKVAFDLQTRNKVAFLLNGGVFSSFTLSSLGLYARTGVKVNLSDKIGLSFCPEFTFYGGKVFSIYEKSRVLRNGNFVNISEKSIKLHQTANDELLSSIRIGVHF